MLLKGRQERVMQLITGLSRQTLILSILVMEVDGPKGKENNVS